jgi:hypothetical protein
VLQFNVMTAWPELEWCVSPTSVLQFNVMTAPALCLDCAPALLFSTFALTESVLSCGHLDAALQVKESIKFNVSMIWNFIPVCISTPDT